MAGSDEARSGALVSGPHLPHPVGILPPMARAAFTTAGTPPQSPSRASLFSAAARVLAHASHEQGLVAPGFRSPPRIFGVDRSVRHLPHGVGGVVSVRLSDRPFTAAIADMIEGVIVVNKLTSPEADRVRRALWRHMLQFTLARRDEPRVA